MDLVIGMIANAIMLKLVEHELGRLQWFYSKACPLAALACGPSLSCKEHGKLRHVRHPP